MAKNKSSARKGSPAPVTRSIPAKPTPTAIRQATAGLKGDGPQVKSIRLRPTVLSHDQISQRAYQLWQRTGNTDEVSNWKEAERQLKVEQGVA